MSRRTPLERVDVALGVLGSAAVRLPPRVVAETASGRVAGRRRGRSIRFAGIPFAAAPVGSRRFRPPGPPPSWTGVRDATEFGPQSPQQPVLHRYPLGSRRSAVSEDCLYLDVTTGSLEGRRPVMVWIHPGGWIGGAGSNVEYDGAQLATAGEVVVVSINYRLGPLGWLHLDHLGDEARGSTNLGILDQVAALRWVQENITAFGGDPSEVTVFGASAGGSSIAALLGSPMAEGLFHRAIIQSAPVGHTLEVDRAAEFADRVAAECGATTFGQLQQVEVDELLAATSRVSMRSALGRPPGPAVDGGFAFGPVIDGAIVPKAPLEAFAEGSTASMPLVVGTNLDEWRWLYLMVGSTMTEGELDTWLEQVAGPHADQVLDSYRRWCGSDPVVIANAVVADRLFALPCTELASAQARREPERIYVYQFRWSRDPLVGATHGMEQPFVFGRIRPWQLAANFLLVGLRPPRRIMVSMRDAWTAFARTGDPNHALLPTWRPYGDERSTMVFDDPPHLEADYFGDRLELWRAIG